MSAFSDKMNKRMNQGRALGVHLIGLSGDVAAKRAVDAGFTPLLVGPDVGLITANLSADRLCLYLDSEGAVTAVEPG